MHLTEVVKPGSEELHLPRNIREVYPFEINDYLPRGTTLVASSLDQLSREEINQLNSLHTDCFGSPFHFHPENWRTTPAHLLLFVTIPEGEAVSGSDKSAVLSNSAPTTLPPGNRIIGMLSLRNFSSYALSPKMQVAEQQQESFVTIQSVAVDKAYEGIGIASGLISHAFQVIADGHFQRSRDTILPKKSRGFNNQDPANNLDIDHVILTLDARNPLVIGRTFQKSARKYGLHTPDGSLAEKSTAFPMINMGPLDARGESGYFFRWSHPMSLTIPSSESPLKSYSEKQHYSTETVPCLNIFTFLIEFQNLPEATRETIFQQFSKVVHDTGLSTLPSFEKNGVIIVQETINRFLAYLQSLSQGHPDEQQIVLVDQRETYQQLSPYEDATNNLNSDDGRHMHTITAKSFRSYAPIFGACNLPIASVLGQNDPTVSKTANNMPAIVLRPVYQSWRFAAQR